MTAKKANAQLTASPSAMYQKDVQRTKSTAFFGPYISRSRLVHYLTLSQKAAEPLDVIKKSLYYGRNIGEGDVKYPADLSVNIADEKTRDILHGLLGIITEAGELAERLAAVVTREGPIGFTDEDVVNIFEESGDVLWYLAITADATGLGLDAIMTANIEKLKGRYPEKFESFRANERNIEKEQNILKKSLTKETANAKLPLSDNETLTPKDNENDNEF